MTRRERLVLLASTVGFSMVLLDTTVVNVALGTIARDLHAGPTTLEWVANAYTLVFAGLLLTTGLAAGPVGARRVFLAGVATFAVGSAAAAAAPSAGALVGAQALLGLGAALVLPTSLALLTLAVPEPAKRARAVGTWAAGSAAAFALGPVVGGALTDAAGWRWIFLVNVPVALLATALAWRPAPPERPAATSATTLAGQAGAIVALGALTFGLIEGGDRGWESGPVLAA